MAKGFGPKPLVDSNLVTEFGAFHEAEGTSDVEMVKRRDYTYFPGFSDMRLRRDQDLSRHARGEIKGGEVSTLPVNVRWFRCVKGTGSDPDQMRVAHARNAGYRPVTEKDLGQAWFTELPPGGMIAPDGTIKTAAGDSAAFVCDQETAARNAFRKKKATEDLVDGMEMDAGGLGNVGKSIKGSDPVVNKTIGEAH